jgi:hypothetical protein
LNRDSGLAQGIGAGITDGLQHNAFMLVDEVVRDSHARPPQPNLIGSYIRVLPSAHIDNLQGHPGGDWRRVPPSRFVLNLHACATNHIEQCEGKDDS